MAFSRPFGQTQAASPWSSGVPPGFQQQQPPAVAQQMFSQPMGAFDLTGAYHGQQATPVHWQQQPAVQFVPNSANFIQQQPIMMSVPMRQQQQQQQPQRQQRFQQQQRGVDMHQRSLSAPRMGGNKRANNGQNQNKSFGGQQRHQQSDNNNNQQQQRAPRQNDQNSRQQKQQQQQQSAKATKAAKKQALAKANKGAVQTAKAKVAVAETVSPAKVVQNEPANKPPSKTAERKQLKLQARKNAEALKKSKMPVVKAKGDAESKDDQAIDQSQLKCVPAVFGFVCKACEVFLRDRAARIEHINSDDHKQKYTSYEVTAAAETESVSTEKVVDQPQAQAPVESDGDK